MDNAKAYALDLIRERTEGRKLSKTERRKIYKQAWAEAKRRAQRDI